MKVFLFLTMIVTSLVLTITTPLHAIELRNDGDSDSDSDGLSDAKEVTIYHTDPANPDTDGDGFSDGEEVTRGYSPRDGKGKRLRDVDTDKDGLWDDWEIALGTDLTNKDTDNDGYSDGQEVKNSYDPLSNNQRKVKKHIDISLTNQSASYFFNNVQLDKFTISSGKPKTPTPKGSFTILQKRPVVHYAGSGYNYPNTKWNLMFKRGQGLNYYIHGAWWHNKFGTVRSSGCVNVPYEYAYMGRLYDWAIIGAPVLIY